MIALTSISPNHKNDQSIAINTWHELGFKIVSFNNKNECDILRKIYKNVNFIETEETLEKLYKRPHIAINVLFDYIANYEIDESFCIINSDIELKLTHYQLSKIEDNLTHGFLCANRFNYNKNKVNSSRYDAGFDVFFLKKEHINVYCESKFALGQCHFDYWLPFRQLNNNKIVFLINDQIAFHQEHAVQYSDELWKLTGRHFAELENMQSKDIGAMSTTVYKYLYKHMKRIDL